MVKTHGHLVVACAVTLLMASGSLTAEATEDQSTVTLRWALGAIEADADAPDPIHRDTQLSSGTRLKFLVEPLSKGSVFLILLDSSDDIATLYHQPNSQHDSGAEPAYIPPGSQWFELDDQAGMETFFLLASVDPLHELESLIAKHEAADGKSRKELGTRIVTEIRRLHKQHRNFSRPVEKPVIIGGQTRSGGDENSAIDRLAVEVEAETFYGKTITINH
jgi:hypothetical protein